MRLRDFFTRQPARHSRGEGSKDKPVKQLPLDADGLIERALDADGLIERAFDGDAPDIEGFAEEAVKERRKLWNKSEDDFDNDKTHKRR